MGGFDPKPEVKMEILKILIIKIFNKISRFAVKTIAKMSKTI